MHTLFPTQYPCYCCGSDTGAAGACSCGWNPDTSVAAHLAAGCLAGDPLAEPQSDPDPALSAYEAWLIDEHERYA